MKILTAHQMREIDQLTVERCGISYPTLMETAGARVVEAIISQFGRDLIKDEQWAVFCGKGNNGGDGAVVARLLWMNGAAQVRVYLFGKLDEIGGEARVNLDAVKRISTEEEAEDVPWHRMIFHEITDENDTDELFKKPAGVFIDALLGTGVKRKVEGLYAKAVEAINYWGGFGFTKVVAVDIPSGLSSDSPHPIGPYVRPDLTVTLTAPKIANATCADGKLVVASIGTPWWLLNKIESPFEIAEESEIRAFLRGSRRAPDAHKGSVGDVLLIAGSRGKTGAAALSSESILRAGAGLVTVATARSAQSLLVTQARTEVMTEALEETHDGAISNAALDRALRLAQKRTVIAIGPGLSSSDESTRAFAREMVEKRAAPMVIDADGLNALAPWPEDLKGSDEAPIIVTPHPGEMARLTGKTNAEVVADRINVAQEFATKHHIITVLKGSRTIIASPGGEVYVNPTGNAGMATAGSGDVLTGLVAGLLAQRPSEPLEATIAAVYLHGLAGDLAANRLGMRPLIASDIIANLSEAILQVGGDAERGRTSAISTI
jgi:ADP-dependent NAD(P)H-hydrate dehydratase / NAD(P)H-hydrate epimerase